MVLIDEFPLSFLQDGEGEAEDGYLPGESGLSSSGAAGGGAAKKRRTRRNKKKKGAGASGPAGAAAANPVA